MKQKTLFPFLGLLVLAPLIFVLFEIVCRLPQGAFDIFENKRFTLFEKSSLPGSTAMVPAILASVFRLSLGTLIGTSIGIGFGVVSTASRNWSTRFLAILSLLLPIPPMIWLRSARLHFGPGDLSVLIALTASTALITGLASVMTMKHFPSEYRMLADSLPGSPIRKMLWIYTPYLLGSSTIYIRICLLLGWPLLMIAESDSFNKGIGSAFIDVYQSQYYSIAYFIAFMIILTALCLDRVFVNLSSGRVVLPASIRRLV